MTVREWFRQDRAAMWQRDDHPAHGCAREIDRVARLIAEATNLPTGVHLEVEEVTLAWPFQPGPYTLWLPADHVRDARLVEAADALGELLYLAWPEADRARFGPPRWTGPVVYPRYCGILKGIAD